MRRRSLERRRAVAGGALVLTLGLMLGCTRVTASGAETTGPEDGALLDGGPQVTESESSTGSGKADDGRDPGASEPCLGVTCSGHGTCVVVDGAPTCRCHSGYYRVDLACVTDPCGAGGTCLYVDAILGSDTNPGTRTEPWQSLGRVEAAAKSLAPGSYVLFRRGGAWTGSDLIIDGVTGTETQPVTFGAYGPVSDPRPRLRKILLHGSSHVTVRDFEVSFSAGGPCVAAGGAVDHPIVQDLVVHDCVSNGIYFGSGTAYGVMIDNLVYDIHANDALVIHNPVAPTLTNRVGDHHWIVDNRVPGPVAEQPIDVATGTDEVPGVRDVKIVGNRVAQGTAGCIVTGHGTSVVWIVGNFMGNCPTAETAAPLQVGGLHGERSGTLYQVRGNVVFWNLMASGVTGELPQLPEAIVDQNTFITAVGRRPVWTSTYPAGRLHFTRNLLWTTGSRSHVAFVGAPADSIVSMDRNWYVPDSVTACTLDGLTLPEWQGATGFDLASTCGPIPGLERPTEAEVLDFDAWTSPAFLSHFVPDPSWSGCADAIGAFDCAGRQRLDLQPFADYDVNGGRGWEGPLGVRQRYPLP